MNQTLKEEIKDIGFQTANVEKDQWYEEDFENIQRTLLSLYDGIYGLDNDSKQSFLENLLIEPSRSKYLKDNFEYLELSTFGLIDEFEFCETMNDFVESVLDGYGVITKNNFIVTLQTL
ncbi:hypothetical protein [Staphylococcus hsinchuensis]|uniref:Uncharacterized protein n=1 Tax=Staphylococcus hsinchuensis TaxID=3051183 RepID=A0ABZ3EEH8_9STAP